MQKNNMLWWTMVIALLLTGFIIGWTTKPSGKAKESYALKIHDTLKTTSVQYKIVPDTEYNIDSLIFVINQFWKDSLKNMYGKGLFESKFSKSDDLGKRDYTLTSRIPLDPESQLTVDETFVFPKKKVGLIAGINTGLVGSVGLRYYMFDSKCFSFVGFMSGEYLIDKKTWRPCAGMELEYRFY